ncbi:MAG: trk system potassium uptake protein TrkA [Rhodobacteraceae bacterium HLUCCO18]|nr:MAG: trk system potassium uptake protein TrkA [Rhodobacteraceae bacterium HLUCCO18]
MRIVVLGASRFGEAIAGTLIEHEHEVVVIDQSREKLEALAQRLDCGMLHGDGTMPTTLREVYRGENDVFVAVTNASEDNILASLVARSIGFGRVIPQIVSSELMDVCEELKLHDAINPHATVAQELAEALEDRTELAHESALTNQLALKRLEVPEQLSGSALGELDLPENARVVAIIRGVDEHLAGDDVSLETGDDLLIVTARDDLDALVAVFEAD